MPLCPFGEMGSRQTFFLGCDLSCSPQEGGKSRHFGELHVCETEGSPCERCWAETGAFAALSRSLNLTFQKFLGKASISPVWLCHSQLHQCQWGTEDPSWAGGTGTEAQLTLEVPPCLGPAQPSSSPGQRAGGANPTPGVSHQSAAHG